MITILKNIIILIVSIFFSNVLLAQKIEQKKKTEKIIRIQEDSPKQNYRKSSINTITAKKDSLLNIYGTFKAARVAGAIAPKPKEAIVEKDPKTTK